MSLEIENITGHKRVGNTWTVNGKVRPNSNTWDFTINNYTEDEKNTVIKVCNDVRQCCVSIETGELGTTHLQGRIQFKRAYRFAALQKMIPRAHWEMTKCSKDMLYPVKVGSDVFLQKIHVSEQGNRTDLKKLAKQMPDKTLKQLVIDNPVEYIKYHSGIDKTYKIIGKKRKFVHLYDASSYKHKLDMNFRGTHIVIGPAGVGKTGWCLSHFSNPLMVTQHGDLANFDPDEHDGIVFDDIDLTDVYKGHLMVNLLDFDYDRTFDMKYLNGIVIPANTKKIITHNNIFKVLRTDAPEQIKRVTVTEVGIGNTNIPTSFTNIRYKNIKELF